LGRKVEKARALLVLLSSLVVLGWGINGASKALSSKFVGPRDAIVVTKSRLVPTIENVQIQDIAVSVEDESPAVHRGILDRGHLQVWSGQGEGVIWNQEQPLERYDLAGGVRGVQRNVFPSVNHFQTDACFQEPCRGFTDVLIRREVSNVFAGLGGPVKLLNSGLPIIQARSECWVARSWKKITKAIPRVNRDRKAVEIAIVRSIQSRSG